MRLYRHIIAAISAVALLAVAGIACWQFAYVRPHRLLLRAETLMQDRPDSALQVLQQMRRPQWLMGENEALYALLMTQSCYKNGISVANDSLIRIATRHYATAGDPLRYAWSLFYEGQVARDTGDRNGALRLFQQAELPARQAKSPLLSFLLYHHWEHLMRGEKPYEEGSQKLEAALRYAKQLNDTAYILNTMGMISMSHIRLRQYDEAEACARQAFRLAETAHDASKYAGLCQQLAHALTWTGKYAEALSAINTALHYADAAAPPLDSLALRPYWSVKADAFLHLQQYDSARYYTQKVSVGDDFWGLAAYHLDMYKVEKGVGNCMSALQHHELYSDCVDSLIVQKTNESLAALQKKYDYEKFRNENLQLKAEKRLRWMILGCFMVAGMAVSYYIYSRVKRKKERIIREKDDLLEQYAAQQEELKDRLFKAHDAVKRIEEMDGLNSAQKVQTRKDLQLSKKEKANLFAAMNLCHNDFEQRLRTACPSLTDDDVYLCCLLRMGVSNENIVILLDTNDVALKKRKYRIKHDKMDVPPQYASLEDFLRAF